jgi:hypothetical protein
MKTRERIKGIVLVSSICVWTWYTIAYMNDALVRLNTAVG